MATVVDDLTVPGPLPTVGPLAGPLATVPVAEQAVDLLLPDSVDLIGRAIRGQIRVPAAVRVNAALRVLEMSQKEAGKGAQPPAGMADALSALGKALSLRSRTLDAVEVRTESVVPDRT